MLYNELRVFYRERDTSASYDAMYEVIDADMVCLYLDVEVDQLKPGTGNISADQLSLVARDAEQWHAKFPDWYQKVAGVPWTKEELSIASHEAMGLTGSTNQRYCCLKYEFNPDRTIKERGLLLTGTQSSRERVATNPFLDSVCNQRAKYATQASRLFTAKPRLVGLHQRPP